MFALIENGTIKRINISLPINIGNVSIPKGATGLDAHGLYPIVGDAPTHTDRERVVGPQYVFDGKQVNRVYTVEAIPEAEKAAQVRAERDRIMAEDSWRTERAFETGVPLSAEYLAYRQALRDITSHENFPYLNEADWPVLAAV